MRLLCLKRKQGMEDYYIETVQTYIQVLKRKGP